MAEEGTTVLGEGGGEEQGPSHVSRPANTFEEYMESMKGIEDSRAEMRIDDDEANPQIEVG